MKSKIILKSLIIISCLLLSLNMKAQDVAITIHVETAGTLPTLIAESKKYQITNLTLTGELNGTDIRYIREMAGRPFDSNKLTEGELSLLDISNAKIVKGGISYYKLSYDSYFTSNNAIGHYAFAGTRLTKIIVPNSVNTIGEYAFNDCENLISIVIPDNITNIGKYAFWSCAGLKDVIIGNGVASIEYFTFADCKGLTNLTLGDRVSYIGMYAFRACRDLVKVTMGNGNRTFPNSVFPDSNIKEFIVSEENTSFSVIDGVLFNKDKTTLFCYPKGKSDDVCIIPNSVTSISVQAFYDCVNLKQITIPNVVTSIGSQAFYGCTNLTSTVIPDNITSIESYTYFGCTSLTNIKIPNSVTSIGEYAFSGCTGLNEIHNNNPTPLIINSNCFGGVDKKTCKLFVPKGSYNAYWLAYVWGDFENIIEENVTANDNISDKNITISNYPNGISINAEQTTTIYIFNLSGQKVYEAKIQGTESITLNKGIYIVRVGNESQKIVVR